MLPLGSFLEYLADPVNGKKAEALNAKFDWRLVAGNHVDAQRLTLSNGALNHLPGSHGPAADAVIETTREEIARASAGRFGAADGARSRQHPHQRRHATLPHFRRDTDEFDPMFNVVEP